MNIQKKNILIVGNGAVPSALAKKLYKHEDIDKIYIAPGNGIKSDKYENVDIREDDLTGLLKFALEKNIDLTIPTSELSICNDIVSFFLSNGQKIFGPSKDSCNVIINKALSKKFLYKLHAQTSKFGIFDKLSMAEDWLKNINFPVTIKCEKSNNLGDRLVCSTVSLAREFLDTLFAKGETSILIEEYTFGHNFTVYYITDGYSAVPLIDVGNYKFAQDGDSGLYTNGIGCYCPDYKISEVVLSRISNIVQNVLIAMDKKGSPYVGILGLDCTLTGEDKFYVNEFKPFLQDFDAHAVLNLLEDDLLKIFSACIDGLFADEYETIHINNFSSIAATISAKLPGKAIEGLDRVEDFENIDFINIKNNDDCKYITNMGDSFVLTHKASTLSRARNYLYDDISVINFSGMKYRKDICI